MVSQLDLDQGGTNRQWVRKFLGNSLGWAYVPNDTVLSVTTGGTTTVLPGVSLILVNVASTVTLQLPTAVEAAVGPQTLVYGYERVPITIVDLGGHATANNITILPFDSEKINGNSSASLLADYSALTILPNIVSGGWNITNLAQSSLLATTAAGFATRTAAAAASIPTDVQIVITGGLASAGDGGSARYIRAGGSTSGGFQSLDGQWWQIVRTGRFQRSVTATPIVIAIDDEILLCNIASAATCALPAAATRFGCPLTFKDLGQATARHIVVTPNGAEKIDGQANWTLSINFQAVTFNPFNDGVNSGWFVT